MDIGKLTEDCQNLKMVFDRAKEKGVELVMRDISPFVLKVDGAREDYALVTATRMNRDFAGHTKRGESLQVIHPYGSKIAYDINR